ncbi:hypothetical protein [Ralstonia pseudosolanacearum]|uniref:hypothetical protein n=1 Tax=Ralstonia pseudosolanacearum TaxID=1310165 RepID=UPI001E5A6805|nr:hypothetical protein [Ralstonia pseudosolanacearum]
MLRSSRFDAYFPAIQPFQLHWHEYFLQTKTNPQFRGDSLTFALSLLPQGTDGVLANTLSMHMNRRLASVKKQQVSFRHRPLCQRFPFSLGLIDSARLPMT